MKLVTFGETTIQKNRRIALDRHLMTNAGLEVGSTVEVLFDADSGQITIRPILQKGVAPQGADKKPRN